MLFLLSLLVGTSLASASPQTNMITTLDQMVRSFRLGHASNSFQQAMAGRFETANTAKLEENCEPSNEKQGEIISSSTCTGLKALVESGFFNSEATLDGIKKVCQEQACLKVILGAYDEAMKSQKCTDYISTNQSTAAEVQAFKDNLKQGIQGFGFLCATRADDKLCLEIADTVFDDTKSNSAFCPTCPGTTEEEKGCCAFNCMGCCFNTLLNFFAGQDLTKELSSICGATGSACPNPFDSNTRYVTVEVPVEGTLSASKTKDIKEEAAQDLGVSKEDVYITTVENKVEITIISNEKDAPALQKKATESSALKTELGGQKVTAAPTATTVQPAATKKTSSSAKLIATPLVAALVGLLAFL
jgi:hypothetical protein